MQLAFIVLGIITATRVVNGAPKAALSYLEPNRAPAKGYENYNVTGVVRMVQKEAHGLTELQVNARGLKPNTPHGFHIHSSGDIYSKGCQSTGSHYNPFLQNHGGPKDKIRHVGDLGNIFSDEKGEIKTEIVDHLVSLSGPYTVYGKAFVLHALRDDIGRGKGKARAESLKTGNAGARLACGIIASAPVKDSEENDENFARSDSTIADDKSMEVREYLMKL